jgi:catechol 2,3-dioxygenase-like lactoylglutathione lyase family enzyme
LDHPARVRGVSCTDYATSKAFYSKALAAIGYELIKEFPASVTGSSDVAGFGEQGKPDFWIASGKVQQPVHVAFRVGNRGLVKAFYAAALAAGGKDNGGPGIRAHYHASYFGAFVLDPDGHNIEAVCHVPE